MEKTEKSTKITEKIVEEDVRLDKKVIIRSIAPWLTGAQRKTTSGDISIAPLGTALVSREEIIAQSQNGNKLINGINGTGDHATWYIEDDFARKELYFDNDDEKQEFLSPELIDKFLELKTDKAFESNITNRFVTRAEKSYLISILQKRKDRKINDPYNRVAFCEHHSGMRLQ